MAQYGYGYDYRRQPRMPYWYPGAFWAGAPVFGWGEPGMWGASPGGPLGHGMYGRDYPRRRPEESAAYGRGGDEAVRRYARSHGYDAGYPIRPHPGRPPRRARRYDRGYPDRW